MRILSRRSGILLWIVGLCWLIIVIVYPVSIGLTRTAGIALTGILALGLLLLWWRYRFLRWLLLGLYAALALFAVWPGREDYDRPALQQEVKRALLRYEGVRYYWGGESFRGIDCSGLVRRGVIDGTFLYGARTLNPYLIRKSIALWWHDVSAREMGAGARGEARMIAEEKSIAILNDKDLKPGDFAITTGGVHALAYLGDHIWIEADPGEMKVIQVNARTTKNGWFHHPISAMRWRLLETPHRH